jgi:hypothetical protein
MKKPIRVSNGVNALKLTSAYRLQCMADADGGLVDSHCAYKTYRDSESRTICVFAVQDEIFAFTEAEANSGPFGEFTTMGIGDVRKLWNYTKGAIA